MGKSERRKGSLGQREATALIEEYGPAEIHRGAQGGAHDRDPDIRVRFGDRRFAVEVKRTERLNLPAAWRQAIGYAGEGSTPAVMSRRSREEWLITLRARDFWGICGTYLFDEAEFERELAKGGF